MLSISRNEVLPTPPPAPIRTLILGCGYLGLRVGLAARDSGNQVYATTRHRDRARQWVKYGFRPLIADWTDRRTLTEFPVFDRILVAVSYDRNSRLNRYDSQVGGLGLFLESLQRRQGDHGHLCYISTTGVYHQGNGQWVDEASPSRANRDGGLAHLQAETLLRRKCPPAQATILRLAGIYGPGRVPRAADVIAGRPIHSPEHGYLNLIHVQDAATAVLATWRRASENQSRSPLYVVADDQPVLRGEFYREIARQCGAPPPRFEPPSAATPALLRTDSNKRIWNRKMKRDLVCRLKYSTYREGLADVLRNP